MASRPAPLAPSALRGSLPAHQQPRLTHCRLAETLPASSRWGNDASPVAAYLAHVRGILGEAQ